MKPTIRSITLALVIAGLSGCASAPGEQDPGHVDHGTCGFTGGDSFADYHKDLAWMAVTEYAPTLADAIDRNRTAAVFSVDCSSPILNEKQWLGSKFAEDPNARIHHTQNETYDSWLVFRIHHPEGPAYVKIATDYLPRDHPDHPYKRTPP